MKNFFKQLGWIVVFMAVGTGIDFVVHSSHEAFHVEPEYFVAKMIFGVVWGLFGYYILKHVLKVTTWKGMALGVPALIAGFLQTKYFYQGRDNFFVFLFLILHFLMFLPASFVIFKKLDVFPLASLQEARIAGGRRWIYFIGLLVILEFAFYIYFNNILGYHRL